MATGASRQRLRSPSQRTYSRRHWWERIVPPAALLAAIVTAGPQWMEQLRRWWEELPPLITVDPAKNSALWVKNYDCTKAPESWLARGPNIRIASTVCPSGDVFIHAIRAGHNFFSWLTLDDIVRTKPKDSSLIPAAQAATLTQGMLVLAQAPGTPTPQPNIICHRFIDKRYLLRRVQTPEGCIDETIDMYDGTVVSTKPAPCTQQC